MSVTYPDSPLQAASKRIALRIVVVAVVVLVLLGGFFWVISHRWNGSTAMPAALPITFAEIGTGSRNSNVSTAWGLATTFSCTACATINFTLGASAELKTNQLGLEIFSPSRSVLTDWVTILWNASTNVPLAGYSNVSGAWAWVAATGSILPISGIQSDHLMLISTSSMSGQGNILYAYGYGVGLNGSVTL
jgi:hypothetical protein